ncbi:hypothetical protein EDC56_0009 [Sinobacterium caligoides]|uniref:Z-ring associated protein G n=1 Tax=Sinobacterium caligoides TaxID=933926 RepID=A0A3N2E2D9_9GAMM|nr:DUF1043 family protein [Sinobacterium caligoides]ROS06102.1 hypothetical protein EDC56_0009 [Sinobacterium caligoides]
MFSTLEAIIIAALFTVIGAAIGIILSQQFSSNSRKNRDLSGELNSTKDELNEYQQQVEKHFVETARLVDNLTQSYRDVHNHLAQAATDLLDTTEHEQTIKKIPNPSEEIAEVPETITSAPLDYAPKDPNIKHGVLDESFGLDKSLIKK